MGTVVVQMVTNAHSQCLVCLFFAFSTLKHVKQIFEFKFRQCFKNLLNCWKLLGRVNTQKLTLENVV